MDELLVPDTPRWREWLAFLGASEENLQVAGSARATTSIGAVGAIGAIVAVGAVVAVDSNSVVGGSVSVGIGSPRTQRPAMRACFSACSTRQLLYLRGFFLCSRAYLRSPYNHVNCFVICWWSCRGHVLPFQGPRACFHSRDHVLASPPTQVAGGMKVAARRALLVTSLSTSRSSSSYDLAHECARAPQHNSIL